MLQIYTLKNCDTCKKALKWLESEGIAYINTDVRADGLDDTTVRTIIAAVGVDKAVNKRSATWKALSEEQRVGLNDASALSLILDNPTLMKRPVFVVGDEISVGFDAKIGRAHV